MSWDVVRVFFLNPLITFPLLILFWPIFTLYYLIILLIAKFFSNRIGNPIHFPTSIFDEDMSKPNMAKYGVAVIIKLNGLMDLTRFRDLFSKNILPLKEYKRLTEFVTSFKGIRFWKREEAFNLNEHILEAPPTWASLPDDKIHTEVLKITFPDGLSPWKIYILQREGGTSLILYFHHTLTDAYSLLKLVTQGLAKLDSPTNVTPTLFKVNFLTRIVNPFLAFISLIKSYSNMWSSLDHPWRDNPQNVGQHVAITNAIPLENVKNIAKSFKVSVSAVLFAIFCGGARRTVSYGKDFSCTFPLPKMNHPSGPTNHFTHAVLTVPCSQDSIEKRVLACQTAVKKAREQNVGEFAARMISFLTDNLPYSIRKRILKDLAFPMVCVFSNLVGPNFEVSIDGLACLDATISTATGTPPTGVVVTTFSYKGSLRYSINGSEKIFSESEAQRLADNIYEEYSSLLDSSQVIIV